MDHHRTTHKTADPCESPEKIDSRLLIWLDWQPRFEQRQAGHRAIERVTDKTPEQNESHVEWGLRDHLLLAKTASALFFPLLLAEKAAA